LKRGPPLRHKIFDFSVHLSPKELDS
jgi:hypothetical protein